MTFKVVLEPGEDGWIVAECPSLRVAILLIGGDKTGDGRWYEKFVPVADRLYEAHLDELRREGNP